MIVFKISMVALSLATLSLLGFAFNQSPVQAETMNLEKCFSEDKCSSMRKSCRLQFAYDNLSVVRDLGRHQPRDFYDASTFERQDVLRPSSYSILANPEKFDGKVAAFSGYLKKSNHCCCPMPGDECYHIFISKDDYQNSKENCPSDNYVHLRTNNYFFAGNGFPDGSLVEGRGLMKAGKMVLDQVPGAGDSASTLLNGSLRLLRVFDTETLAKTKKRVAEYKALRTKGIDPWNSFMLWPSQQSPSSLSWEVCAGKIVDGVDRVEANDGVLVLIDDQDSELKADSVIYEKSAKILRTIGHVRILRRGQLTTGQRFDFKIASDEYLVTEPGVTLGEPLCKVRTEPLGD
jgi:hypothetical protein